MIETATDHPFVCGQNKTFYLSLKREKISFTIDLVEIKNLTLSHFTGAEVLRIVFSPQ